MSKIPFSISELCISSEPIPQEIADKLLEFHITPMIKVREELGGWVTASQKSGYRPKSWEIMKGRSGNSQHTFQGKGAVDWTASDLDRLEELIITHTNYTRIVRYDSFIHCDYKATDGKRYYFTSDAASNWTFIKFL